MAHRVNPAAAELGASLMCADQGNLRGAVAELDRAGIDYFHFDVMDGRFVPNFALGGDTVQSLRPASRRPFDAHLMIARPGRHLDRFIAAGADWISVHVEAARDTDELKALARATRRAGREAGAALNPATPVSALAPVLGEIDFVCLMAVEPGFAGQKFIAAVLPKIDELAALIRSTGAPFRIQVDGNVSPGKDPGPAGPRCLAVRRRHLGDLPSRGGPGGRGRRAPPSARPVPGGGAPVKIVVVGSIVVDLVAHAARYPARGETVTGESMAIVPGGKGANQAVACARMGCSTELVGAVGEDSFAVIALKSLADFGVGTGQVHRSARSPTGLASIVIDASASNTIVVIRGANDDLPADHLARAAALIAGADALLVQLEIPLARVEQAMEIALRSQVPILLDPAPARQISDRLLALADFITPNEQETETLTGIAPTTVQAAVAAAGVLHRRGRPERRHQARGAGLPRFLGRQPSLPRRSGGPGDRHGGRWRLFCGRDDHPLAGNPRSFRSLPLRQRRRRAEGPARGRASRHPLAGGSGRLPAMNRPTLPAGVRRLALWLAGASSLAYILSRFLADAGYGKFGNLEDSYLQALHLAFLEKLQFGRDIVFTYGPWAFLYGGYHPRTHRLDVAIWIILALVFWWAAWRIARSLTGNLLVSWLWLIAFAAVAGVEIISNIDARLSAWMLLLWLLYFFVEDRPLSPVQAAVVVTLALVGLIKFSLLVPAAAVVLVIAADTALRRRRFPWILPLFAASLLGFWMAAGQTLGSLGPFLRRSGMLAGGFGAAMGIGAPTEARDIACWILASLALCLLAGWVAWKRTRWFSAFPVAALAVMDFVAFKYGYVRHDVHELAATLELAQLALAGLALVPALRGENRRGAALAGGLTAAFVAAFAGVTFARQDRGGLAGEIAGSFAPKNLGVAGRAILAPAYLNDEYESYRAALRAGFPLPRLAGPTDIYPWDVGSLLANGLSYRPRPVLQSYAAYTPELAELNAAFLRGPRAPDHIIFSLATTDGRFPALDDGRSWPELLTRYDIREVELPFLVLGRAASARTWRLAPLADLTARFGEPVPIPPAAAGPVWARIGIDPTPRGRLVSLFYKPPELLLGARLADGTVTSWRLIPGMAAGGFLLSPVVENTGDFAALATGGEPARSGREIVSLKIAVAGTPGNAADYRPTWRLRLYRLDFPRQDPASLPGLSALQALTRAVASAKLLRAGAPVQLAYVADEGTVLVAPPDMALLLPVPTRAQKLDIGFGISGPPPPGPVTFRISALRHPDDLETVWRRTLDPAHEPADRGRQQAAIDLSFWPNAHLICETLSTAPKKEAIPAYWAAFDFK